MDDNLTKTLLYLRVAIWLLGAFEVALIIILPWRAFGYPFPNSFDWGGFAGAIVGVLGAFAAVLLDINVRRKQESEAVDIERRKTALDLVASCTDMLSDLLDLVRPIYVALGARWVTADDEHADPLTKWVDGNAMGSIQAIRDFVSMDEQLLDGAAIAKFPSWYAVVLMHHRRNIEPRIRRVAKAVNLQGNADSSDTDALQDLARTLHVLTWHLREAIVACAEFAGRRPPEQVYAKPTTSLGALIAAFDDKQWDEAKIGRALIPFRSMTAEDTLKTSMVRCDASEAWPKAPGGDGAEPEVID